MEITSQPLIISSIYSRMSQSKIPKLLSINDLQTRWKMTRPGVHQRIKRDTDFPKPIMKVSNNTISLFTEEQVIEYEQSHPEALSPKLRLARNKWIYKTFVADKEKKFI